MKNSDKPINPCVIKGRQGFREIPTIPDKNEYGLTKREYFAGLAMQGILNNSINNVPCRLKTAKFSVEYADELLKQENDEHNS